MPGDQDWIIPDEIHPPQDFQAAIGGHPLVAETLYRRGFRTVKAAQAFLNPDAYSPTPASELPDFEIAAKLLAKACQHHHKILVWGDFDVDGQTSTTLLVEGLRQLGGNVTYHIPIRAEESHGITHPVLKAQLERGFDLLLTCDTGSAEHEHIRFVRETGKLVIVTDHHTLPETLPPANALVNPQSLPPGHPLRTLPGVGVAYKLIEGLFTVLAHPFNAGPFLELAALGIVADVAELQGDTRYLLQKGVINLQRTDRIGLQTLYKKAALNPTHINEDHIGFQIGPRLNAVGRLGDANLIVEFLTTEDTGRARVLATQIEALNAKRRFMTRQVEKAAEVQLQASAEDRHAPAIVLHHPSWPGGVVGIVANRLVERYHKPAILLTGEDPIHGSGRSVAGINITEAIATQVEMLTGYGGHPMAAGLSFPAGKLAAFKRGFLTAIDARTQQVTRIPELHIHGVLSLDEINLELIQEIGRLSPFGPGNPPLHFLLKDLTLVSATTVGQHGEHRQVLATDEKERQQRFIWWNGGDQPLPEAQFDLVCTLSQSDYKGTRQVSAEWIDFRLAKQGRQQVAKRHFAILDHRDNLTPIPVLKNILSEFPGVIVWGEGETPGEIQFSGRHQLCPASTLVVWTAPPSRALLEEILQSTSPNTVIIFGREPNINYEKDLMERLAGLAKFAVRHKKGQAKLTHLAAACAAENEAVTIGLQLWEAMGKLKLDFTDGTVLIKTVNTSPNPSAIAIFESILKDLLAESQAYRRYFQKGALNTVLPSPSNGL
jgi:single-stranded-DNA-specific exonuclease